MDDPLKQAIAPRKNVRSVLLVALALVVLAVLPQLADMFEQPAMVSLATRIIILAIAAASLNLALG